jgi:hypothetical protein
VEQLTAVEDLEALLGKRQAAVQRPAAERDVVVLAAGEMDEVRPPIGRVTDHEVNLRPLVQEDARLVGAGGEHALDLRQSIERGDDRRRIVDRGEDVEVADGGAPSSE